MIDYRWVRACSKSIEDLFGIELKWYEEVCLKNYINSYMTRLEKEGAKEYEPLWEGIIPFMIDHFGLDANVLGKYIEPDPRRGGRPMEWGMDLLGTPEFKQYCQNHVQEWRDERELI